MGMDRVRTSPRRTWVPILLGCALTVCGEALGKEDYGLQREEVVRAGEWSGCVVEVPVGNLLARAITYDQTVYRQGPTDRSPRWLFEQESTGSVGIRLREDGVLFVQPDHEPPRLYFPGSEKPLLLSLPGPQLSNRPYRPFEDIHPSTGYVAFLGDVLFYGRDAFTDHYVVGFARIDSDKRQISAQCVCAEATADKEASSTAWAAGIGVPAPLRIGRYVFWRNRGWDNDIHPNLVTGLWKPRATRVVDLETCALLSLSEVPADLLRENQKTLAPFLEPP
jgi:hypothetical protein